MNTVFDYYKCRIIIKFGENCNEKYKFYSSKKFIVINDFRKNRKIVTYFRDIIKYGIKLTN